MAWPNIDERRAAVASAVASGGPLTPAEKRALAAQFGCHPSAIHADAAGLARPGGSTKRTTTTVARGSPLTQAGRRAYGLVAAAIRAGTVPHTTQRPCADCGKQAQEYHHPNGYGPGHELDTVPLCRACHKARHAAH